MSPCRLPPLTHHLLRCLAILQPRGNSSGVHGREDAFILRTISQRTIHSLLILATVLVTFLTTAFSSGGGRRFGRNEILVEERFIIVLQLLTGYTTSRDPSLLDRVNYFPATSV